MGWLKKVCRYFFGAHNHAFVRPLRLVALISIVVFVNIGDEYRAPIDDTIPADAGGTPQSSQQAGGTPQSSQQVPRHQDHGSMAMGDFLGGPGTPASDAPLRLRSVT